MRSTTEILLLAEPDVWSGHAGNLAGVLFSDRLTVRRAATGTPLPDDLGGRTLSKARTT